MPQPRGLQFTLTVGGLSPDVFSVVSFELTERLSALFDGVIHLASHQPDIAPEAVLEQPLVLTVWQHHQPLRQFTGVVCELGRGATGHHRTRYHLRFRPPAWRLELRQNSRIFQSRTPEAMAGALLAERGCADARWDLRRQVAEREYCVQYRERDWAFIERLAAEEGWHYRYDHGRPDFGPGDPESAGAAPSLVFADHHRGGPRLPPVRYQQQADGSGVEDGVFRFRFTEQVGVASVALQDYGFRRPDYAQWHQQEASAGPGRRDYEHFDYPGRFKSDATGSAFTGARLDSLRRDTRVGQGQSGRADFCPGARVLMQAHPDASLNRTWVITSVAHSGQQPQALEGEAGEGGTTYYNGFEAVPDDVIWRPAYRPPPRMAGPQIATVTGPEGEEVHCDVYGRVKVRFPWDRSDTPDAHSSAWLRVSQAWAGPNYGFLALPRVGHEVIVSFLGGDPDQPVVTGRTYHAVNQPPYPLPEHQTRTTLRTRTHKGEGHNELRFEDQAGAEQVLVRAEKDKDVQVGRQRAETIGNDHHRTVRRHHLNQVRGDRHQSIGGSRRDQVGGDDSLTVNGRYQRRQGTSERIDAGTEIHHQAGLRLVIEAGADVTLKAGGSFVRLNPAGITVSGPTVRMNSGGGAGPGTAAAPRPPRLPEPLKESDRRASPVALPVLPPRPVMPPAAEPIPGGDLALLAAAADGELVVTPCQLDAEGRCQIHPNH
ncbi:type VI secretion system Vgr family protein [Marinobacter sp. C2H3]|uniref:type VI secretion system Vgr family protein n=1 Tax=Marinobacter sp. C2H3 TaxID=3119003 RepID=UPI00300EE161